MADTAKEEETKVVEEKAEVEEEVDLDFEVDSLGDNPTDEDKDKAIKTLTAQKKHWRKKAENPEIKKAEPVEDAKPSEVKSSDDLSQADFLTVINAKIPQADLPSIVKFAKSEGITMEEALKTDVVQAILDTNKEKRTVADATNTGKSNKSQSGISDDELMANAKQGILPESDTDMERLAKLRLGV